MRFSGTEYTYSERNETANMQERVKKKNENYIYFNFSIQNKSETVSDIYLFTPRLRVGSISFPGKVELRVMVFEKISDLYPLIQDMTYKLFHRLWQHART